MKVLIVCHHRKEDIGTFEEVLRERGFTLDIILGHEDKLPNIEPSAHDLTIIMGGAMGVYEADEHPYLYSEIEYIKKRIEVNKPLLGICLGGQLIAKALGGEVYKGKQGRETGWREIHVTDAGKKSPVHYLDATQTKMTQGHQDTFDLPDGAVLLATSEQYQNQAFSYGDKTLGFQYHPEMDEERMNVWLNEKNDFLTTDDMPKDQIAKDTKIYADKLKLQTAKFFNAWLDEVGLKEGAQHA